MVREIDLLLPANAQQLVKIREALGEDPDRLENNVKLFKEWLRCSNHLPNDVDRQLIENFIRLCKHDLERAKNKFEAYVALKPKFHFFFCDRVLTKDHFYPIQLHRWAVPMPKLTEDGYRVFCFRLDTTDPSLTDYEYLFKYYTIFLDHLLYKDVNAGLIGIYDMANFDMRHAAKMNFGILKSFVDLLYNIGPFRVNQLHVVNIHPVGEWLINITKAFMSAKLKDRMIFHKGTATLLDYISADILVKEYCGIGESLDNICDRWRDWFLENSDWLRSTEELKLTGPLPKAKRLLYSFEDASMIGSFRQLNID